jgi:pantothenate kinase
VAAEEQKPERMTIANLRNGLVIEALFNPEEIKETITPIYNRVAAMGMSHQQLQYQNTENHKTSFTLEFDAMAAPAAQNDPSYARRFMMSLCYSSRASQDIVGGAPPRVLFLWPNLYRLECVVTKLQNTHKRFRLNLASSLFAMEVEIEEARDVRLYSEDVLDFGTQRSGTAQGDGT